MLVSWYSPKNADVVRAGVFHLEQSVALQKYCNVAIYYPFDTDLHEGFSDAEEWGVRTFRRKVDSSRLKKYLHYIRDFREIKKRFSPDLIHAHVAMQGGRVAVWLGRLFHVPVIVTEHTPVEWSGIERKKDYRITGNVYGSSRMNVCVSEDSKERLSAAFPGKKFTVIYNGIVDPDETPDSGVPYREDGKVNFCIIAAFYDKDVKGYQHLLPAVKILSEQRQDILLHIVGGGEYLDYYKKMAEDLHILPYVRFYGQRNREEVYGILKQMDFSISASLFECSGVSVQEAMLLGKPLVVTTSGGADSLVTEDTAIVVKNGSTEALAAGLMEMLRRFPDFSEEKIRNYAYESFEIDKTSRKYMELYEKIVLKKE